MHEVKCAELNVGTVTGMHCNIHPYKHRRSLTVIACIAMLTFKAALNCDLFRSASYTRRSPCLSVAGHRTNTCLSWRCNTNVTSVALYLYRKVRSTTRVQSSLWAHTPYRSNRSAGPLWNWPWTDHQSGRSWAQTIEEERGLLLNTTRLLEYHVAVRRRRVIYGCLSESELRFSGPYLRSPLAYASAKSGLYV